MNTPGIATFILQQLQSISSTITFCFMHQIFLIIKSLKPPRMLSQNILNKICLHLLPMQSLEEWCLTSIRKIMSLTIPGFTTILVNFYSNRWEVSTPPRLSKFLEKGSKNIMKQMSQEHCQHRKGPDLAVSIRWVSMSETMQCCPNIALINC